MTSVLTHTYGLSTYQLERFARTPARPFPRRTYLPDQGHLLWLLKRGAVRTISYLEDGSTVTLGVWSEGDIVGKSLSRVRPYIIESLTEVEAVSITDDDWIPPTEVVLSYWQETEALFMARASHRVDLALLGVLKWLAQRFGQIMEHGCLIDLRITHQDLAELAGTTRVTVTRLLKQFEDQGLIMRVSRKLILAQDSTFWHYQI